MTLDYLYKKFSKHKEGSWIIDIEDAYRLFELCQAYKVQKVLDLGSGVGASSTILALTVPRVLGIEQFQKCINIAETLVPAFLMQRIEFIQSEVEVVSFPDIPFMHFMAYKFIPEDNWDFIVVDGPGPFLKDDKYIDLPHGDIINLLPKIKSGVKIYIDGRLNTVSMMQRFFQPFLRHIIKGQNFNIFERTELEYDSKKLVDSRLEFIRKNTTYFSHAYEQF